MKAKFEIAVESIRPVNELPGIWEPAQCRQLLQLLEFDDIDSLGDEETRDYAIMAL